MGQPRYPIEPLLRAAGCYDADPDFPDVALARLFGHRTLKSFANEFDYWRLKHEGLTWRRADVWACTLGLHPVSVWPTWIEDGADRGPEYGPVPKRPRREPRWGLIRAEVAS